MPVVHVYTAEGWHSAARKKLMVQKITDAVVEAEGNPAIRDLTYVLIHEIADGGWGFHGRVYLEEEFRDKKPADL